MKKKYPFNGYKNAHNIEFRIVRLKNEIDEIRMAKQVDICLIEKIEHLIELLEDVLQAALCYNSQGIAYLTGKQVRLAKRKCCVGREYTAKILITVKKCWQSGNVQEELECFKSKKK